MLTNGEQVFADDHHNDEAARGCARFPAGRRFLARFATPPHRRFAGVDGAARRPIRPGWCEGAVLAGDGRTPVNTWQIAMSAAARRAVSVSSGASLCVAVWRELQLAFAPGSGSITPLAQKRLVGPGSVVKRTAGSSPLNPRADSGPICFAITREIHHVIEIVDRPRASSRRAVTEPNFG
jgi:hypothetical protein